MLTIASLNTRGVPLTGSHLAERYAVIGAGSDAGDADVVCCQEVLTYWHLRLLVRRMRSFRQVSYWPAPAGPAGGLVTFSRRPVSSTAYRRFGRPPRSVAIARQASRQVTGRRIHQKQKPPSTMDRPRKIASSYHCMGQ